MGQGPWPSSNRDEAREHTRQPAAKTTGVRPTLKNLLARALSDGPLSWLNTGRALPLCSSGNVTRCGDDNATRYHCNQGGVERDGGGRRRDNEVTFKCRPSFYCAMVTSDPTPTRSERRLLRT